MISLFLAGAVCSPVPCMVVLCCRLCGKRVDCSCQNCYSDGICKCLCCEVEPRRFRPLAPQPLEEGAIPTNPPTASADGDGRHRARSRNTGAEHSGYATYSYANPDRVIFSVPGPTARHGRAGGPPNTRQQEPRPYEVPQSSYGSTGTTARGSVQPPARNRQHSGTNTAVTTQPHSSAVPARRGNHPGDNLTVSPPPPHVTSNFTSSPPALPPRDIRSHSGPAHTPDPRGNFDTDTVTPLPIDGDSFPVPPKPKSSTITGETSAVAEASAIPPIHDTPPPVPPRRPADVLVMSRPGTAFSREESMQGKSDAALLTVDIDDIHLTHQSD